MNNAVQQELSHITCYADVEQGSDAWMEMRCGILTASEMKNIITPKTLKAVSTKDGGPGDCEHLYELAAQRITGYVEPTYVSGDMMRGHIGEVEARELYEKHFAPVDTVGFITNNKWGFTLGYSPDGLVMHDGLIEVKSPRQKSQLRAILTGAVPTEHNIQIQTGLLVSERQWCDFISYCGGMPMKPFRVYADEKVQAAIIEVATTFHEKLDELLANYDARLKSGDKLIHTERKIEEEMYA